MSEEAVLAGVRVDGADADARVGDAGFHQRVVRAHDGALDQAGVDFGDGVDEAGVGGDVNDPQLGRNQQHGDFFGAGEVRQHLGVSGKDVSRHVQGFFVERRGADGVGFTGHGQLGGAFDEAIGGFAPGGREFAEGKVGRHNRNVDDIDRAGRVLALGGRGDGVDFEMNADDFAGLAEALGVADDQRTAAVKKVRMGKALHDDFGPDPRRVAHGDRNDGT